MRIPQWLAWYGRTFTAVDDPRRIWPAISPYLAIGVSAIVMGVFASLVEPVVGYAAGALMLVLHAVAIRSGWLARGRYRRSWRRFGRTEFALSGFETAKDFQERSPSYQAERIDSLDNARQRAQVWLRDKGSDAVVEVIKTRDGAGAVIELARTGHTEPVR